MVLYEILIEAWPQKNRLPAVFYYKFDKRNDQRKMLSDDPELLMYY